MVLVRCNVLLIPKFNSPIFFIYLTVLCSNNHNMHLLDYYSYYCKSTNDEFMESQFIQKHWFIYMYTTVHVLTFSLFFFLFFFLFSFLLQKLWLIIFLLLIISLTELHVGSNSVSNRTAVLVVKQIGLPLHSCLILLNTCTFEIEVNSG